VIEGLNPATPSPGLLMDEHPQRERDAEKDREKRRRGVTWKQKEERSPWLRRIVGREKNKSERAPRPRVNLIL